MDTPLNLYDEEYHTPVIVACRDANGIPVLVPVIVAADENDVHEGEHYAMAERQAFEEGYELPDGDIICIDYQDAVQSKQAQFFVNLFENWYELVDPANPPEGYQPKKEWSPVIVALFRNEEQDGEITEADLVDITDDADDLHSVLEQEFTLWALDHAIEAGLPIDPDSGADMTFYGYYNQEAEKVKLF